MIAVFEHLEKFEVHVSQTTAKVVQTKKRGIGLSMVFKTSGGKLEGLGQGLEPEATPVLIGY